MNTGHAMNIDDPITQHERLLLGIVVELFNDLGLPAKHINTTYTFGHVIRIQQDGQTRLINKDTILAAFEKEDLNNPQSLPNILKTLRINLTQKPTTGWWHGRATACKKRIDAQLP